MGLFDRRRAVTASGKVGNPSGKTVAASAARLATGANATGTRGGRALIAPWQAQSLQYYDALGEIKFAGQFYAKAMSGVRIFPAYRDENGELTEILPEDDRTPLEILDRVRDPAGGRSAMQADYGRLKFLTGESFLLVTGEDDGEKWEVVSGLELTVGPDGDLARRAAPGLTPRNYTKVPDGDYGEVPPGAAWASRMWTPHPAYKALADAPMQGVLNLCEELLLLEMVVRARVKSRLAGAGLLYVPEEITFPAPEGVVDDADEAEDYLLSQLIKHMSTPIQNEGSASAVVPFLLRGPAEFHDAIKHFRFSDPNETYRETGLRKETIERIAIGLDMPPEVLLGMATANHWTAWQIDDQVARAHIFPVAQAWCDDLNSVYFRPACEAAGVKDWENIVLGYDAAGIVVNPDESKNALDAFDRGVIGPKALRDALGFEESDADDLDELNAVDEDRDPEEPQVEEEPPEEPGVVAHGSLNGHRERVIAAAEVVLDATRRRAGAKLRAKKRSCPECFQGADDIANDRLPAWLGAEKVQGLGMAIGDLVAGTSQEFQSAAGRYLLDPEWAATLGNQVQVHAARTMYDPARPELPPGFAALLDRMERGA